jgi:hypothetical protein
VTIHPSWTALRAWFTGQPVQLLAMPILIERMSAETFRAHHIWSL